MTEEPFPPVVPPMGPPEEPDDAPRLSLPLEKRLDEQLHGKLADELNLTYDLVADAVTSLIVSSIELPECIPFLEKVDTVPGRLKLVAKGLGSAVNVAVGDLLKFTEYTNQLYHVHHQLVVEGRQAYERDLENYHPEPEKPKRFMDRFKIKRDHEVHIERLEDRIPERYFAGWTSRVSEDFMIEYVELGVHALRGARSRVVQHQVETRLESTLQDARLNYKEKQGLLSTMVLLSRGLDRLFDYINTHEGSMDALEENYLNLGKSVVQGFYRKWEQKEEPEIENPPLPMNPNARRDDDDR